MLRFLGRFVAFWCGGLLALAFFPAVEEWMVRGTVASAAFVLRFLPVVSTVSPPLLHLGGITLRIIPDCTPLLPTLALFAAILAFPSAWRWKAAGMAAGAAVLWLFNLGRLFGLLAVLIWAPRASGLAHVYVLQTLTLLMVLAIFAFWIRLQRREQVPP